jgi:hypothetical protein
MLRARAMSALDAGTRACGRSTTGPGVGRRAASSATRAHETLATALRSEKHACCPATLRAVGRKMIVR